MKKLAISVNGGPYLPLELESVDLLRREVRAQDFDLVPLTLTPEERGVRAFELAGEAEDGAYEEWVVRVRELDRSGESERCPHPRVLAFRPRTEVHLACLGCGLEVVVDREFEEFNARPLFERALAGELEGARISRLTNFTLEMLKKSVAGVGCAGCGGEVLRTDAVVVADVLYHRFCRAGDRC